ncbi:multiheme c-type cytochrome [Ignavibacterium sp.]|uniref:multiheme c-type cytochrome n=1 Tax=Ignavibacterium sp. TaxID=2651167 RepID=UPI00307CCBE0
MKKLLLVLSLILLLTGINLPQVRGKIIVEPVTPHRLEALGLTGVTNSVSNGLNVIAKGTYAYLSAKNIGNTDPITTATFTLQSKPGGSVAVLEAVPGQPLWTMLKPDVNGQYVVALNIVTSSGTHDTTLTIYSSDYMGVGTFDGVTGQFPSCTSCHSSNSWFTDIYDEWKNTGHANIFNTQIRSGAVYYSTACMKCHTTGYDHNNAASNNGFDDVALSLGWTWYGPPHPTKWDSIKTGFPGLVKFATIGCENCHGAASSHPGNLSGNAIKGNISQSDMLLSNSGNCGQCHDEPWRHNRYAQWENSLHAEALWSNSFAQGSSSQNNSLQNCIRCHDGRGFVNFTKGQTTNTTGWTEARHTMIGCATCHDPHGNTNEYSLRNTPAGSDTLGNGYSYTGMGGNGNICMNCHKARRDNVSYSQTQVTSQHWGPHYSVQTDVFLGQNAAQFTSSYLSGGHKYAIGDACVTCHMVATPDTGNVNRDKVGQHTFRLYNPDTGYEHLTACTPCHGTVTSANDFMALTDYDSDGQVESIPNELDGLLQTIRILLPPTGIDSISWQMIRDMNDLTVRKAYWNYQLIAKDGSKGMHNSKFAFDVLLKTKVALGQVIPVELTSFTSSIQNGKVLLNWETATETNNHGFEVERRQGEKWTRIGFVEGKGTTSEISKYSYTDNPKQLGLNGTVYYRLRQVDYNGVGTYTRELKVNLSEIVDKFTLAQNYPNPFNPSTKIKFTLPYDSNVKLTVYNINGEVVKELVNGLYTMGEHEVVFNMGDVKGTASGIYLYNITATSVDGSKSFNQTRKMVLIK